MKLKHVVPVACLALVPFTLPSAQAQAAPAQTSTSSTMPAMHSRNRQYSQRALEILAQVEQARQAIAANQSQEALHHIHRALAIHSRLMASAQSYGHSLLVPLYWEFDESSVLGPMMAQRKDASAPASKHQPVTVQAASTQYTFVALDLRKVERRLVAAQSALQQNQMQQADASLSHIADELVVMKVQGEYPLLAARENLGLAEMAVSSGHYQEAAAALKEASITLDQYASSKSSHRPYEAKSLSKRIAALSGTVEHDHAGAAQQIDKWWNEVSTWFSHPIHG
jgi:flagellin-specific chaperone FliS